MSDVHGAEADPADDFDLSDVPMDGEDRDDAAGPEGDEGGEGEEGEVQAQQQDRAPLEGAEWQRRYENSRTALQNERRERRQERQEFERRLAALEGGGRQSQRADVDEQEIDIEVDPLGALKQMRAKIAGYEAAERQQNETESERRQREQQYARVEADLSDHEADFREQHADYDDAASHFAMSRARELGQIGLTPQQIQATLREEFIALAQRALQARKNPAAVVYELAKGRGYAPGQADKGQGKAPERGADGKFKAGGKLEAIAQGQRGASPLGRAGGRPNPNLDARTVGSINIRDRKGGEAFDKAFAALERQARAAER